MFSRSRLARAVVGLSLVSLSAVPLRAQNPTQPLDQTALQRDPLRPARFSRKRRLRTPPPARCSAIP